MPVNETIVREFFELHGFLVRQQRKFLAQTRTEDEEIDFFVWNPHAPAEPVELPFILGSEDVRKIGRAIVAVIGWHTGVLGPAVISREEISRFAGPAVFEEAQRRFGADDSIKKVLVVPGFPQNESACRQAIDRLREKGIDAAISFRTLLSDLLGAVETNRNYVKSDLLQTIRLLKNYDFIKSPQLELFRPPRKKRPRGPADFPPGENRTGE